MTLGGGVTGQRGAVVTFGSSVTGQSVPLLDHFEPEQVVVVDRDRRESTFSRLDSAVVNRVLAPHLWDFDVWTDVTLVTTSRKRKEKGGVTTYGKLRNDLIRRIRQHRSRDDRFTTMVDLYALPEDFSGREAVRQLADPYDRVKSLEKHFREDIDDWRFIPYLQLHEFEAPTQDRRQVVSPGMEGPQSMGREVGGAAVER